MNREMEGRIRSPAVANSARVVIACWLGVPAKMAAVITPMPRTNITSRMCLGNSVRKEAIRPALAESQRAFR